MKILRKIIIGILVIFGVVFIFEKIDKSSSDVEVEETEAEIMASGDNDYPDYLDEQSEESKREQYDNMSLDELLDELEGEFNKILDEAFYESLDPYEQFVYDLQSSLTSYVDSVYTQYGDSTRTIDTINANIELDKYFTDLYYYEDIKTEEDLISSIENSKFRSVCDRTIGDALHGNLEDVEYFVEEVPNKPENVYVTYTGIDKDYGMKYTIRFEVFGNMCIGVNSVYCNNRSVGGIEDVLAAVEYVLR